MGHDGRRPGSAQLEHGYFKGMVFENSDWDYRTFDPDRDTRLAEKRTGAAVDGIDPNLKPFKQSGGKLILYQSWNETTIPPRSIIDYYRSVEETMGGPRQTRDFVRLFMVAGLGMCPGFRNAKDFDALEAMQQWVEKGLPRRRSWLNTGIKMGKSSEPARYAPIQKLRNIKATEIPMPPPTLNANNGVGLCSISFRTGVCTMRVLQRRSRPLRRRTPSFAIAEIEHPGIPEGILQIRSKRWRIVNL